MSHSRISIPICLLTCVLACEGRANDALTKALTFHASFDKDDLAADFSQGAADRTAYIRRGKELIPATQNAELKIVPDAGRYGGALWFPRKGTSRPQYHGPGILNYTNDQSWSTTVCVWLRL